MLQASMDVRQSEHDPAIYEFLQWRKSAEKMGCRGANNDIHAHYISETALKAWLTQTRIQRLLAALFKDDEDAAPDAARVRQHFLRPFAILLSCGFGSMIRLFVNRPSLRDGALPFFTEPTNFPKVAGVDLFQSFYRNQWHFCVPRLEYRMDDQLCDDYILPMVIDGERGRGGSAVVREVTVDPEYNGLVPSDSRNRSITRPNPNTFALKTFRRNSEAERHFNNECTAHKVLQYNNKPHPNIIGYYGSFVRDGVYNMLLEYADRGTLNDYLQQSHEPTNDTGITTFWTRFLGILHGLAHIHGTPRIGQDQQRVFLGWHHDLTPDNILVVSRSNDSPHDCEFKIGDFGLAHFKRLSTTSGNATDTDQYGSNAYSAPEAYRSSASERERLQVPQNVEIWSMGCIFSEVAAWVTEGKPKVLEYRRRRRMEVQSKSKAAINEELFFHDFHVLEAVKQIHEEIKRNSRPVDRITGAVVQSLVKAMMRPDHHARASAKHFLDLSRQILDEARPTRGHTVSDGMIDTNRSRFPPCMPLPFNQYSERAVPENLPNNSSGEPPTGNTHGQSKWNTPNSGSNSINVPDLSYSPPSSQVPRPTPNNVRPLLPESPPTEGSTPSPDHRGSDKQNVPDEVSSRSSKPVQDGRPNMSVDDGLRTKRRRDEGIPHKYKDQDLFRNLDSVLVNRDHVFLIDNVASMEPHKQKVRNVLELLTALTLPYDPDGLELYFTTEGKRHKTTSIRKVLSLFDEHPAHGQTDMRARIASIIEPYQAQFGKRNYFKKLLHPTSTPSKGPRKLSLYVLTDGVWDPKCTLITEIKALVTRLQREGIPNKHVGIQFIRFGDDKKAIERLEILDSKLRLELDIVDTTSADGNVYKMLLGSLNDFFDDDDKQSLHMNGIS